MRQALKTRRTRRLGAIPLFMDRAGFSTVLVKKARPNGKWIQGKTISGWSLSRAATRLRRCETGKSIIMTLQLTARKVTDG